MQQKLIDNVRETHCYCLESYEKMLKEFRDRVDKANDLEIITSYHELIERVEKELVKLKSKTPTILSALDIMQQDLDSLR